MKKRILGLALALIMVISLLPLTTFAANVGESKLYLNSGSYTYVDARWSTQNYYVAVVDNDSTPENLTDKKLAVIANPAATDAPADNYLKYTLKKANSTLVAEMTFKNFDTTGITVAGKFGVDAYGFASSLTINLEGTNVITTEHDALFLAIKGDVLITGTGSLVINRIDNTTAEDTILKNYETGTITIKDTTFKVLHTSGCEGQTNALRSAGPIVIDNATVELCANNGSAIRTATHRYNTGDAIKNVDVTVKNNGSLKVYNLSGQQAAINNGTGKLNIENASLEAYVNTNATLALKNRPYLTGNFSTAVYNPLSPGDSRYGTSGYENKNYSLTSTAGEAITSNTRYFKFVHEHKASGTVTDCTAAATCACGYAMGASATAHAGVVTDCTKDTMCTNPGCQQVYAAKRAAHEAKDDDGDCTTAVTCKHCTTVTTPAETAHKDTRTDCAVAGTCANTGCQHAFAAGQHNPEADDGNCTTAIKCATCGKEAKAGEAAHKYTDKADTTCDNAGCTNTRKVEGTENPKTGDNAALVLVLSLMAASAAAFVCTKKFVR